MRKIKDTRRGEAVDVGVVGEVVAEGVDGEDDADTALREACLLAQPVLQGVGDEVAELGEALWLFAEDIAKHSGYGKYPVPMWDGQADFIANEGSGVESTTLVAAGATAAPFAGKGQKVVVVAVGALDAKEAAGEIAAAKTVA